MKAFLAFLGDCEDPFLGDCDDPFLGLEF